MPTVNSIPSADKLSPSSDTATKLTRALLACGIVAAPLYVIVSLIQTLTREGFDLTRHAWSLLANGELGWIQSSNFLVTGLLTIAGAIGMWRVLHPGRGGTWGPLLIGAYGLGLIGAGIFTADPALGFPPGTPDGPPEVVTLHGILHFVCAGLGFLALIAACFVFSRRFSALGQRGWAVYSAATGVIFFVGFLAVASGSQQPALNVAFIISVIIAWAWVSVISARLVKELK